MKKYLYMVVIGSFLILFLLLSITTALSSFTAVIIGGEEEEESITVSIDYMPKLLVNEDVAKYRDRVLKEAKEHGTEKYINLFLAVMMQESGGQGSDVFQASESLGVDRNSLTVDQSIKQGVRYLSQQLNSAKCKSPTDEDGIRLALQGYNFGGAYITYALNKDGKWTQENTFAFAEEKSGGIRNTGARVELLGPWRYGDQYYTDHVLRYYSFTDITTEEDPKKIALEKRMEWLFPEGTPTTAKEMEPYLTQVKVPIYTTKKKKGKMTLTVHKKLANQVKDIFKELQDAKFQIDTSCTAAYCFRNMASNSSKLSYHSYGCAIDVNWTHNGASYTSWPYKPHKDKLAVTKRIVKIWKKYDWYWGGDWSKDYFDPMHFTYVNH